MSYSTYGPSSSSSDGGSGSFRGRGGGRNDSFRARGRGDRGGGRDDNHSQQPPPQVSPPLPPPDNESNGSGPPRPDSGSRAQYSRYGTLIAEGAPSSNGNSSQFSRGGGSRGSTSGRGGRDGGMPRNNAPLPTVLGPPRPMMFVPSPQNGMAIGGPPPMGMVPMMVHPGAGGRGGLHVQPPRGAPLVVGGREFHNPPPMQIMQHQQPQVFQIAPQQMQMRPSLPMASPIVPLPAGWSEHYTPQGLQYFFNAATGVSTYERPTMAAAPIQASPAAAMNSSQVNGDAAGKWIEYKDDATGQLYYYHTATRATVWEQPEAFRMQQAREEVERMKTVAQEQAAAEAKVEAKKKHEAEQKSKVYEHLSREERVALFKDFLEQKEISPQLKWQDAQRFIAKEALETDPRWRFALTTAGEKKQSFAEYCTQAINKQSIEKRRQVKKNREDFLDVLAHFESLFVPGGMSFSKGEPGYGLKKKPTNPIELEDVAENPHFYAVRQDPRWLVIADQKEKRSLLSGFMQDIVRKHEQMVIKQKDATKKRFIELLREKADANEIALRGKRRLDSALKQQLWDLAKALDDNSVENLKNVEKYDVYDWSEELLSILRDEEHEQRKREREAWREREARQLKDLDEKLRAMVVACELTAASQWDQVHELLTTKSDGTDEPVDSKDAKPEGEQPAPAVAVDDQELSERAQRHVFETIIKELRLALQPTVDVVSAYLSKASGGTSSSGGFDVHEACTFEAFADTLTDGVRVTIDEKKPEDGEEEDETMEDASASDDLTAVDSEKVDDSVESAVATSPDALKQQRQSELEILVKSSLDLEFPSSSVEFPQYIRDVYELLVAIAKEKKAATTAPPPAVPANNPQSSERSVRSPSRSRKRHRDDGRSLSPASYHHHDSHHQDRSSISRSRSRPRVVHKRSRSRSHSKPLDRSVVWNTSSSSSKSKFIFDPLNGDDAELTLLPKKPKQAPLTAEQESARAEEIIRQARLKLQEKQDAAKEKLKQDDEMEEGEEPEEGEEAEE